MKKLLYIIFLLALVINLSAQDDKELTKAAQNPIANLISIPFQNNTNFNFGPFNDRTQNVLNIQPVIPLADGRIITRTIFPLVWQPVFTTDGGTDFGLGDIVFTAFYSPESEGVTWGVGPVLSFPTGGEKFGSQKWGAGPSLVALIMPGQWVVGGLVNNVWSFAGEENAADVNFFTFQPFINYNFPDFYLTFSPIISSNWKAQSGQQWTVPLGAGIGKLIRFGKLPVNCNVSYYNNLVKPDYGAEWTLRFQAAILLPASIL